MGASQSGYGQGSSKFDRAVTSIISIRYVGSSIGSSISGAAGLARLRGGRGKWRIMGRRLPARRDSLKQVRSNNKRGAAAILTALQE